MSARGGRADVSVPVAPLLALTALTKPRISLMVVATAGAGLLLGPSPTALRSAAGLVGTWAIVAAANAYNMVLERSTDALMPRTAGRPLPAGALAPASAWAVAVGLTAVAVPVLLVASPLSALAGVLALVAYAALYTPLKRVSRSALYVGALAGAAPPVMGYFAAGGGLDVAALWLFALQYAWQVPHSLAIAIFRGDEYAAAGLAVGIPRAERPRAQRGLVVWCVAVVFIGLLSERVGLGGRAATLAAALSGGGWLALVAAAGGDRQARVAFLGSMAHLLVVLGSVVVFRA